MAGTRVPLHLEKLSFVHWKITDIPKSFIWIVIFFDGAFEYVGVRNFEVTLGQKLNFFV
jgi:hypothetical protein